LDYCDAVEGRIELPIAAAVQPMPHVVARPDRYGRGAVVQRKRSPGFEPTNVGTFGKDLCRGQGGAALELQQAWRQLTHQRSKLEPQGFDAPSEAPDGL